MLSLHIHCRYKRAWALLLSWVMLTGAFWHVCAHGISLAPLPDAGVVTAAQLHQPHGDAADYELIERFCPICSGLLNLMLPELPSVGSFEVAAVAFSPEAPVMPPEGVRLRASARAPPLS